MWTLGPKTSTFQLASYSSNSEKYADFYGWLERRNFAGPSQWTFELMKSTQKDQLGLIPTGKCWEIEVSKLMRESSCAKDEKEELYSY